MSGLGTFTALLLAGIAVAVPIFLLLLALIEVLV